MAFTPPTVSRFKGYFVRDFPYAVPAFGAEGAAVIAAGAVTGITVQNGGQRYSKAPTVTLESANGDGAGAEATATVAGGKVTGFVITEPGAGYTVPPTVVITGGAGDETDQSKVMDSDLEKALTEAGVNFNAGLFTSQAQAEIPFLYLTAHYLVMDIQMSQQGLASQFNWMIQSKSVGSVSASYGIPQKLLNNPALAYYATTQYGAKYLSLIAPLLVGNMALIQGYTTPA